MSEWLMHPGLWLIAAAFVLPLLSGHARAVLILAAPLVSLGLTWQLGDGANQFKQIDNGLNHSRSLIIPRTGFAIPPDKTLRTASLYYMMIPV